jgi:hypothetical protein
LNFDLSPQAGRGKANLLVQRFNESTRLAGPNREIVGRKRLAAHNFEVHARPRSK